MLILLKQIPKKETALMKFLTEKVNKLYFTFLASALGSTLITSIYATVDTIAIGQYAGPVGSAAIACVNPLWPCMLTLGILAGMGGSIMMNNLRGAGNEREANEYFTVSAVLSIFASLLVSLAFSFFTEELLTFFGAKGEVLDAAMEYARPFALGAPLFTLCSTAAAFVRNDGEAFLPTLGTMIGGVINILGDIFFVFDFGLGLGLFGAGLATILGQCVAFLVIASYFFRKKCKLRFAFPKKFCAEFLRIASVGAPAAITEVAFGATTVVFNNVISKHLSDAHFAVYGTASSLLITFYCFYYALGTALQPIVSVNFGAGKGDRVKKTFLIALISAVIMSAGFLIVTELFPEFILNVYMDVDDAVLAVGPGIIRLYSLALPAASIAIVCCYYLQSTLQRSVSTLVSFLRGVLLPISLCLIIPLVSSIDYIWLAVPIAEAATAVFAMIYIAKRSKAIP